MLQPLAAQTVTGHKCAYPAAYDCVRFLLILDGSMVLCGDCSDRPVSMGDVVLVAPHSLLGYEPEGKVNLTTLTIDTDYLIEHLLWQHLDVIPDRDAARDLAPKLYPDAVQILHLGESEVGRLGPILDELVTRTEVSQGAAGYFRTHALLFTVLEAITPHICHSPVTVAPLASRERAVRVAPPRWRAFRPIRREIARIAALMQNDIARRWPLSELAAHACLSPSQLNRVFKDSFGVTPLTYPSILRVQEMARLIRETDKLIGVITERVGWCQVLPDRAALILAKLESWSIPGSAESVEIISWLTKNFHRLPQHVSIAAAQQRAKWFGCRLYVRLNDSLQMRVLEQAQQATQGLRYFSFLSNAAASEFRDAQMESAEEATPSKAELSFAELISTAFEGQGDASTPLEIDDDVWTLVWDWIRIDLPAAKAWVTRGLQQYKWSPLDLAGRFLSTLIPLGIKNPIPKIGGFDAVSFTQLVDLEQLEKDLGLSPEDAAIPLEYETLATDENRRLVARKRLAQLFASRTSEKES